MSKNILDELVCIRGRVVLLILLLPLVSVVILYMNHSHELLMKDEDIRAILHRQLGQLLNIVL